jgi:tetratricopeptide (TPR) repeat protein
MQSSFSTGQSTIVSSTPAVHRASPVNTIQQSVTANHSMSSLGISNDVRFGAVHQGTAAINQSVGTAHHGIGSINPSAVPGQQSVVAQPISTTSPVHQFSAAHHNHHGSHPGNSGTASGNAASGMAHHHVPGNSVQIGQHPVQLATSNYQPSYYRHPGHYHGYWNNNPVVPNGNGWGYGNHHRHHGGYGGYGGYAGYGYAGYGYDPYFWGLGGWGLGSLIYGSGYLGYTNPYFNNNFVYAGTGYNYSQPIPVSYNTAVVVNSSVVGSLDREDALDSAIAAFRQFDYDTALNITSNAISQQPDDAVLHEFRALVLFAKGDYQQAAATIHSVLAVGPGWDWATVSSLYTDVSLYTIHLRALEGAVRQNPQDAAARFLLAYHYLSTGHPDAASRQLKQVVELQPNDQIAVAMLRMTTAPQTPPASDPDSLQTLPTPQPPSTESSDLDLPAPALPKDITPIDISTIIGTWNASRPDGSTFELTIAADNRFTWTFTPNGQKPQSFAGKYALEGNVIALERNGGGSLVAEITGNDGSHFNFRMVGAPREDLGLDFSQ